jgi:hypothetical protein
VSARHLASNHALTCSASDGIRRRVQAAGGFIGSAGPTVWSDGLLSSRGLLPASGSVLMLLLVVMQAIRERQVGVLT